MTRSARLVLRVLVAALVAAGATLIHATPAHAGAPNAPCDAAHSGERAYGYEPGTVEVNPRLTHFTVVNVATGSSYTHTETVQETDVVEVSFGGSITLTGTMKIFLVEVGYELGFTVQYTETSTRVETLQMQWTFNEAGRYGLYRGTRAVSGSARIFRCIRIPVGGSPRYGWVSSLGEPLVPYTTFTNVEVGTVRCGESVPTGSLRELALIGTGC